MRWEMSLSSTGSLNYSVAVLGGGSFGTAIASVVAANGHRTTLWLRDSARAEECQRTRENHSYLPGYILPEGLTITSDLAASVRDAQVILFAVPSHSVRHVARSVAPLMRPGTLIISATKGIESPDFVLMSDVLKQELGPVEIGVLSGPNFAKEIIQGQHTGTVIASAHPQILTLIPKLFSSKSFRVYSNPDQYGVELAGALKNIYAIVTGMATALGCGHNTQAMLLTRSLAEMSRFANRLGANTMTFLGLAGVGDLILTCSSDLSRNFRIGYAMGQGASLDQAIQEVGQVAEGVNTLKIVKAKAEEVGVYMPLVSGLHGILFENQDIRMVTQQLMTGETTHDVEYNSQT